MAAWTCCAATSIFSSSAKRNVITEQPSELLEVICDSPGTCPNCRSKGAVTDEAMTSGPAPG